MRMRVVFILPTALVVSFASGCQAGEAADVEDPAPAVDAVGEDLLAPDTACGEAACDPGSDPTDLPGDETGNDDAFPEEGLFDVYVAGPDCPEGGFWDPPPGGLGCSPRQCQEPGDCPDGWGCRRVVNTAGDPMYVCLKLDTNLCRPCATDSECASAQIEPSSTNRCVSFGPDGNFCGVGCGGASDPACTDGYTCQDSTVVGGQTAKQCVPTNGQCTCSKVAIAAGTATTCFNNNSFGTCFGLRWCLPAGLTACDARTPAAELCNGLDDNCDFVVDEGDLCPVGQVCTAGGCAPPACGGETAGACADAAVGCLCCAAGGPKQHCICSTACQSDLDCADATRSTCNHPPDDQPGICAPADFTCCWYCK